MLDGPHHSLQQRRTTARQVQITRQQLHYIPLQVLITRRLIIHRAHHLTLQVQQNIVRQVLVTAQLHLRTVHHLNTLRKVLRVIILPPVLVIQALQELATG